MAALTAKQIHSILNSGADPSSPELQEALAAAEIELKAELGGRGAGVARLDLNDSAMLRRFLVARKLQVPATVAMLVLSGAIHVDDWENALLFQEAFDFDPKAYAKWKEEQRYLLLRPRHSDEPTQLAGGADLDEDVEASLQHVIAERARQAQELDAGRPGASTTFDLNSLLCCAARKVA